MNVVEVTTSSGIALGLVVVLLLQQLGALALPDLGTAVLAFAVGALVGGLLFGLVGWSVDRR